MIQAVVYRIQTFRVEREDEEKGRQYGKDNKVGELHKELAFMESLLRKTWEAREALETEARQETEQAKRQASGNSPTEQCPAELHQP